MIVSANSFAYLPECYWDRELGQQVCANVYGEPVIELGGYDDWNSVGVNRRYSGDRWFLGERQGFHGYQSNKR